MLTALGDETRQQLLSIMIMGPCSGMRVINIAEQTSLSRPAVSHHMQILKDAGVVLSHKEGTLIYYRLNPNREAFERLGRLLVHVNNTQSRRIPAMSNPPSSSCLDIANSNILAQSAECVARTRGSAGRGIYEPSPYYDFRQNA